MPRPKKFSSEQVINALKVACQEYDGPVYAKAVAEKLSCNSLTANRYLNSIMDPSVVRVAVGDGGGQRTRVRWEYKAESE